MSDVTVVGSINIDLTSYLARWPKIGETVTAESTQISLGGKGANQAIAAARLGADVTMIGAIGRDIFGQDAERQLSSVGMFLQLKRLKDRATGLAFIDVGPDGDNSIRLSKGANEMLSCDFIKEHAQIIRASKVLLLQNEIPFETSIKAAEYARMAGATVIMDPAPAPEPFWSFSDLEVFDILKPNAHEAGLILGEAPQTLTQAQEAAQALSHKGLKGVIITMGAQGVAWSIQGDVGTYEAPKVDTVDTVGAGDCFNGALAAAFTKNLSVQDAISFAANAAALSTTRKGASASSPTRQELEQFLHG